MEYAIWIEAEEWDADEWEPDDTNSECIVRLEDDSEWTATLVTYKNVATLAQHFQESGECLGGAYLYASDMILVDRVDRQRVEQIVDDLLKTDEFRSAFAPRAEGDDDLEVAGDE